MSDENVEIVRAYFEDLDRALGSYWENPDVPFRETAEGKRLRERLHQEVIWRPAFSPDEFYGYEGINRAIADWLEITDGWRISVEDVVDAGGDRVLGTWRVHTRGKLSGAEADQRLFVVCAIREGQIVLIEDHLDQSEALEAAGVRE